MAANFLTKKPLFPLSTVISTNATLVTKTSPFVAIFVGGTAGIGSHTIRALAAHSGANPTFHLRAYIIGRNTAAAENIIDQCLAVCPTGDLRFLKADVSLLREVNRVCAELKGMEEEEAKKVGRGVKAKIDLLVMTQGFFSFQERNGLFFPSLSPAYSATSHLFIHCTDDVLLLQKHQKVSTGLCPSSTTPACASSRNSSLSSSPPNSPAPRTLSQSIAPCTKTLYSSPTSPSGMQGIVISGTVARLWRT